MLEFIKTLGGNVADKIQEHSPEICLAAGIASMVGATIFACKGTIKAKKAIEDAKDDFDTIEKTEEEGHTYDDDNNEVEYTHQDSLNDKAIVMAKAGMNLVKAYGPAIVLTTVGIGLLISGHKVLQKRNLALVAAYESISEAYKKYQDKVKEAIGETAARNLKYGLEEKEIEVDTGKKNNDGTPKIKKEKKLILTGDPTEFSPYARFFDSSCKSWENSPEYNYTYLISKQAWWNDVLRVRENHTVFLNEVYADLGIPVTEAGQYVGWTLNDDEGNGYIDFGINNTAYTPNRDFVNGYEPVCLLDFNVDGIVSTKLTRKR